VVLLELHGPPARIIVQQGKSEKGLLLPVGEGQNFVHCEIIEFGRASCLSNGGIDRIDRKVGSGTRHFLQARTNIAQHVIRRSAEYSVQERHSEPATNPDRVARFERGGTPQANARFLNK